MIIAFEATLTTEVASAADPEVLIREGLELRRRGDDAGALKLFQQAYDLQNSPKATAQIGLCEQALGRWAAADKHLRQALRAESDKWIIKARAALEEALRVVGDHVGRLDVTGTPAGAEIRVDGELAGRLPFERPISVTAGGVAIEVRAPGYLPIVRATNVRVGVLTREVFNLQSLLPSQDGKSPGANPAPVATGTRAIGTTQSSSLGGTTAPSPSGLGPDQTGREAESLAGQSPSGADDTPGAPPPASNGVSARRVLILGTAGLSAVSLAFGIIEHLSWQRKVDSFATTPTCGAGLPARGGQGCQQLYDDGQQAKVLALVGYGVAGGLAITAAILFFTAPSPAGEPQKVACAPRTGPGLTCGFRF